jgi:hypothetical protein
MENNPDIIQLRVTAKYALIDQAIKRIQKYVSEDPAIQLIIKLNASFEEGSQDAAK